MKKFSKTIFAFVLAFCMAVSMTAVSYAADMTTEQLEDVASVQSIIYQDGGSFSNGYWGASVTAPSSGDYKIYYCVSGVTSSTDKYTFALNGSVIKNEQANGTSRVYTKYYSAGSTISIGISGTYGHTYAFSVYIDKV